MRAGGPLVSVPEVTSPKSAHDLSVPALPGALFLNTPPQLPK